mmetsp:Transcript_30123/g.54885  ORF Transcript_30123/g.54885 Transcript_30123/m.54885 type:complete len:285 (-) Transcript_30123:1396-2250(-)
MTCWPGTRSTGRPTTRCSASCRSAAMMRRCPPNRPSTRPSTSTSCFACIPKTRRLLSPSPIWPAASTKSTSIRIASSSTVLRACSGSAATSTPLSMSSSGCSTWFMQASGRRWPRSGTKRAWRASTRPWRRHPPCRFRKAACHPSSGRVTCPAPAITSPMAVGSSGSNDETQAHRRLQFAVRAGRADGVSAEFPAAGRCRPPEARPARLRRRLLGRSGGASQPSHAGAVPWQRIPQPPRSHCPRPVPHEHPRPGRRFHGRMRYHLLRWRQRTEHGWRADVALPA